MNIVHFNLIHILLATWDISIKAQIYIKKTSVEINKLKKYSYHMWADHKQAICFQMHWPITKYRRQSPILKD